MKLNERVELKQKQIDSVLTNKDNVFGVEYEFNLDHEVTREDLNNIEKILRSNGIEFSRVELERQSPYMVEVVTNTMDSIVKCFNHMEKMFSLYKENGWYAEEDNGLHISISNKKLKDKNINFSKILYLIDTGYINKEVFPSRMHVADPLNKIEQYLQGTVFLDMADIMNKDLSLGQKLEYIYNETYFIRNELEVKERMINFGRYKIEHGRIELRFPGGTDYHKMFTKIKHELIRAVYILNVSNNKELDKYYYKSFIKHMNKVIRNTYDLDISDIQYVLNLSKKLSSAEDMFSFVQALQRHKITINKNMMELLYQTGAIYDGRNKKLLNKIFNNDPYGLLSA